MLSKKYPDPQEREELIRSSLESYTGQVEVAGEYTPVEIFVGNQYEMYISPITMPFKLRDGTQLFSHRDALEISKIAEEFGMRLPTAQEVGILIHLFGEHELSGKKIIDALRLEKLGYGFELGGISQERGKAFYWTGDEAHFVSALDEPYGCALVVDDSRAMLTNAHAGRQLGLFFVILPDDENPGAG